MATGGQTEYCRQHGALLCQICQEQDHKQIIIRMADKDENIFERLFSGLFHSGFEKHFEEMNRQMEEMFKLYGDIHINLEHRPPGLKSSVGQIPSSSRTSPRDLMLKEPDHEPSSQPVENSKPGADNPIRPNYRDNTVNRRPSMFTSVFGDRGFFSPFGPGHRSDTTPSDCGCQDNMAFPQSPWQPTREFTSSSSSSSTMYNVGLNNGLWSGESIRTIRHADGSMEKIVNKTENGRTCTTVSRTVPQGVTTTTTTCDQPAIGSGPSTDPSVTPSSSRGDQPSLPDRSNMAERPETVFEDLQKDDANFFSKLFGFHRK